jgi:6-phosphogluconolactonase (cycloisomerase 2 family)
MAVDPAEHFLYVANTIDNTLSVLAIASTTGALSTVPGSPYATGTSPVSVTVALGGGYLYIANQGTGNVTAYAISSNGALTTVTDSPFSVTADPTSITLDASGTFLFEIDQTAKTVTEYPVTATTGSSGTAIVGSLGTSVNTVTLTSPPHSIFAAK